MIDSLDSVLPQYRLAQQAQSLAEKIDRRSRECIGLKSHTREQSWLADAAQILTERLADMTAPLRDAQRLPELADERESFAREPQLAWADAVERLWSGISFHMGRRAPLLEALFPHNKFAQLRRPKPDVVRGYQQDLERRMRSSYVARMLLEPEAQFAQPLIVELAVAFGNWEAALNAPALDGAEAERAREQVRSAAIRLEPAMKQARHLFEAASISLPEPEPMPIADEVPQLQA